MSIADKLTTISENVPKVYEAGVGVRPSGSVEITENGTYDVTEKAEAVVNVPTYEEELAAKTELEDTILARKAMTEYTNNRIERLGAYALGGFTTLQSVNLPAVSDISAEAVHYCTALTSFHAPQTLAIASAAFRGCSKLTRLDFPAVASISGNAFFGCAVLTALILRSEKVCNLTSTTVFINTPIQDGTGYVYVPDELVDTYKTTTNWITYADQIKPISELEETA